MGSVNERFPWEATSKEIWWSRQVDGKEPVCPFAETFVMIVGALVTWAIYTQGQLLLWSSLIIRGVDHNRSCPWVWMAQVEISIARDVDTVEGEDLAKIHLVCKCSLARMWEYPGTVTIPQYRFDKTWQHTIATSLKCARFGGLYAQNSDEVKFHHPSKKERKKAKPTLAVERPHRSTLPVRTCDDATFSNLLNVCASLH